MQDIYSFIIGRLPCARSWFQILPASLFLFLLLCASDVQAVTITFDEYPLGTPITNQYQNLGVVFTSDLGPPKITDTSWFFYANGDIAVGGSPTNNTWGSGNIIFYFVDPESGSPREAENISFWPIAVTRSYSSSVFVTYYDAHGAIVDQYYWLNYGEATPLTFPDKFHKCVIEPTTAFLYIDDLRFQFPCLGTDNDGDGHYTPDSCLVPHDDCDDSDPSIPSPELCRDGIDNDCDGNTDCFDLDCSPDPVCSPPDCAGNVKE